MMQWLTKQIHLFFIALTFLTQLPAPVSVPYSQTYLNQAARYFSLVGVVVGTIGGVSFWIANKLWLQEIAVLLSIIATIVVTGAFHEDGFADSCDAFGGGWKKDQVLAIMKDSRLGTFGTVGITLLLALKFLVLNRFSADIIPLLLIVGHSISRFLSTTLIYTQNYVRDSGNIKAKALAHTITLPEVITVAIFGIVPLVLVNVFYSLLLVPLFGLTWVIGQYFLKRIGGYTGDCLGATQQITEVAFYLLAVLV